MQDREDSLGLLVRVVSRGLWTTRVSLVAALGPGMIKAEEYCLLGCRAQLEEAWHWVG